MAAGFEHRLVRDVPRGLCSRTTARNQNRQELSGVCKRLGDVERILKQKP